MFKTSSETVSKSASTPSGMRLLDVGILEEAMTKLRCSTCGKHLTLYESEHRHGWHTTFYIKCHSCHQLFAEFPSSKPMIPDVDKFVNVKLTDKVMNEVTFIVRDSLGEIFTNSLPYSTCQHLLKVRHKFTSTRSRML